MNFLWACMILSLKVTIGFALWIVIGIIMFFIGGLFFYFLNKERPRQPDPRPKGESFDEWAEKQGIKERRKIKLVKGDDKPEED